MAVMSPGRKEGSHASFTLLLVLFFCQLPLSATEIDSRNNQIVIEISDVSQPYNCSDFFDNLEGLLHRTIQRNILNNQSLHEYDKVEIQVPRQWDFSLCSTSKLAGKQRKTTYARPGKAADIIIGGNHPVFGNHPWSLQARGCGQQGHMLNLPADFMHRITKEKDVILAREWTKYEFGIFSEHGFEEDNVYPNSYSIGNTSLPSDGCTRSNNELQTMEQFCPLNAAYERFSPTKQNLLCDGKSAEEVIAEQIITQQEMEREKERNKTEGGSERGNPLLQPFLQSLGPDLLARNKTYRFIKDDDGNLNNGFDNGHVIKPFNEDLHNRNEVHTSKDAVPVTPTVTGEKIMMGDVKMDSFLELTPLMPNLQQGNPNAHRSKRDTSNSANISKESKKNLEFIYSLSSTTKYNILLDQTSVMGEKNRWLHVKRALFRFINLLPAGSRLNIHAFGQLVKEVLPTTTVTELNRDGLFGRVPRRVLDETQPCVLCALDKVMHNIGHNEVIILITGIQTSLDNNADVLTDLGNKRTPVYVIGYPATLDISYLELAKYGGLYSIAEGSVQVSPLIHLQEIFAHIIIDTEKETIEKIHETHYNSLGFAGTFTFEKEDNAELLITLNVPDEEKVELFEVKDPSGKKRIFSKFEDGMVYFKFNGLLPSGIWSYHAKLYHDSLYPDTKMTVDVITKCEHNTGITAEIFSSIGGTIANEVENNPVRLYAKIMKNGLPILNAKATATLYMPGTKLDDGSEYSIDLHDDGHGYPDITSGDGIYSAFVPRYAVKPGYYGVRLTVTDNSGLAVVPKGQTQEKNGVPACCGSFINYQNETSPTGSFHRFATGPAFYVPRGFPLTKDISPPTRIIDFQVINQLGSSLNINLSWTAPGGDYDFGKAERYEIRCHTQREMLSEENFISKGILVHSDSLPVPQPYGTLQTCNAGVPWTNEVFFYAITAWDERNNRGPISNLVSVYIHEETTTTSTTTENNIQSSSLDPLLLLKYLKNANISDPNFGDADVLKGKFLKLSENLVELERSNEEIYIAVGIVCGVVMMIVILLMSLVMIGRRKRSLSGAAVSIAANNSSQQTNTDSGTGGSNSNYDSGSNHSKIAKVSKVSPDGSSKVLLSWLESLPKTDGNEDIDQQEDLPPPSPLPSHNASLDSAGNMNTISRRNHTLGRTNPYKHRMLTNGSFVSLKDIPTGSEEGSTRLTTSTVDDSNSNSSDTSGSSFNNIGLTSKSIKALEDGDQGLPGAPNSVGVKRSNTSAAQLRSAHTQLMKQVSEHNNGNIDTVCNNSTGSLRRSHNTGYYSFRDYSPIYGTATLGRGGIFKQNLSVLSEGAGLSGTLNSNRRTKRTESFV